MCRFTLSIVLIFGPIVQYQSVSIIYICAEPFVNAATQNMEQATDPRNDLEQWPPKWVSGLPQIHSRPLRIAVEGEKSYTQFSEEAAGWGNARTRWQCGSEEGELHLVTMKPRLTNSSFVFEFVLGTTLI